MIEEADDEESSDRNPFGDRREGRDDIYHIFVAVPGKVVKAT